MWSDILLCFLGCGIARFLSLLPATRSVRVASRSVRVASRSHPGLPHELWAIEKFLWWDPFNQMPLISYSLCKAYSVPGTRYSDLLKKSKSKSFCQKMEQKISSKSSCTCILQLYGKNEEKDSIGGYSEIATRYPVLSQRQNLTGSQQHYSFRIHFFSPRSWQEHKCRLTLK